MTTYNPEDRPPTFLDTTHHFFEIVIVYDPETREPKVVPWGHIDADFPGAVRELNAVQRNNEFSTRSVFALRNLPQGLFVAQPSVSEEELRELDAEFQAKGYFSWSPGLAAEMHPSPVFSPVPDNPHIINTPTFVKIYLNFKEKAEQLQREAWTHMGLSQEEQQSLLDDENASMREATTDIDSEWQQRRNARGGSLHTLRARAEMIEMQAQMAALPDHLRDMEQEIVGVQYTDVLGNPLSMSDEDIQIYQQLIHDTLGDEDEDDGENEQPVDPMHDYSDMPGPQDTFPLSLDDEYNPYDF